MEHKRYGLIQQISKTLIPILWCCMLYRTDSYFSVYLLISIISLASIFFNKNNEHKKEVLLFSFFYSLIIYMANYKLFSNNTCIIDFIQSVVVLISGAFCFFNIFQCWLNWLGKREAKSNNTKISISNIPIMIIFLFLFQILCWIICAYPAVLTPDSISQINQVMTNNYSNHHPFYHTMLVKLFMTTAMYAFNDINMAVACYSVFQIVTMLAIFSYILITLVQMNANAKYIYCYYFWYLIMPFHTIYSYTMWKDVLFAGFVSTVCVSLYRLIKGIGKKQISYLLFFVSGIGMCLFRSNGMIAFLILFIASIFIIRKKKPMVIVSMFFVIICSWTLKHPLLEYLNVRQPDTVEHLSIPLQQIARVIANGNELKEEHISLLENVIDVEDIPNLYSEFIADPIKQAIRNKGNQEFLNNHKREYLVCWLEIGLQYPLDYIKAWIEQTKGYWNGGYEYWIYANGIAKNKYGIMQTNWFPKLKYLIEYGRNLILKIKPLVSIGLHVWILLFVFFTNIIKKQEEIILLSILALAVVFTLLIATPVYSEFRYAYSVFTCLPFVIAATVFNRKEP